jgi:transcriptional regulator with XRE-family HTH domain
MEWYAIVGGNIRRLRDARAWTIEELAHLASIDSSYLGKIELGKKNPTIKKLVAISTALDVDLGDFFQRTPADSYEHSNGA